MDQWTAGIRQKKVVEHWIGKIRGLIKTHIRVTGVIGKPETESRMHYWQPFGGTVYEEAQNALNILYVQFSGNIDKTNVQAFAAHAERLYNDLLPGIPTIDERVTPDEDEESKRRIREFEAEQKVKNDARKARWAYIQEAKPKWADHAIVAVRQTNKSDITTDYFCAHTEESHIIGWQSGNRIDYGRLRQAARRFEHTAEMDTPECENREERRLTKGGHYSTGWFVHLLPIVERYVDDCEVADVAFQEGSNIVCGNTPPAAPNVDGIVVCHNEERQGIEVRFHNKPDETTLSALKQRGFRWSRPQRLWWARFAEDNWLWAQSLVGTPAEQPQAQFQSTPLPPNPLFDELRQQQPESVAV